MNARGLLVLGFALALIACGGGSHDQPPDAAPDPDAFMLCGNALLEGSETCDDGNQQDDDGCSSSCEIECGDGQVTGDEACDTGISSGDPGACPTTQTCEDNDACTINVISGNDCSATCEFAPITGAADDDGCCPAGQDATTDNDCTSVCDNGVVEAPDETCDTAIAQGNAGACPTSCNDGDFCTTDSLSNAGTCQAACTATDITEIGPDDGCCPAGATPGTDPNCLASCGDGFVTGTETCDTAIAQGNPGACPTACNDGNACTTDSLVNAGTCLDACTTTPIGPGPADGCCPAGSDLGDDPDCPPSCGDGVITPPETCDDNNSTGGDGCSAICRIEPVGFRFNDMDLRDPHVFATTIIGCTDVTDFQLGSIKGVNPLLQDRIQLDGDTDGLLDLSLVNSFAPLVQSAGSSTPSDLTFPDCTSPMASTSCTLPVGSTHASATATNLGNGATCLGTVAGTTGGYNPTVGITTAQPGGTCYSANAGTVTIQLGGIPITLEDAQISGAWFGSPATEIRNGLIRGFISEANADATIIPPGTTGQPGIDGHSLSSLLKGGVGACVQPGTMGVKSGDKDFLDGTSTVGWYFYLNFTAVRRPYSEL